jgi:hypothetical protein
MEITLSHAYHGQTFTLTFAAPGVTADLARFDVESRIALGLRREVQRYAEVVAVAIQDAEAADARDADARARKARGEIAIPQPAILLAAGTKEATGRVILPVGPAAPAAAVGHGGAVAAKRKR